LKEIKKDLEPLIKKLKEKLLEKSEPIEMTEGNMLYISLYFVFVMRVPSSTTSFLRDYLMNLML
jgi:hypothetical protein